MNDVQQVCIYVSTIDGDCLLEETHCIAFGPGGLLQVLDRLRFAPEDLLYFPTREKIPEITNKIRPCSTCSVSTWKYIQCDAPPKKLRGQIVIHVLRVYLLMLMCVALIWCRSPLVIRVPIVSKQVQDEARKSIVDEHLPLCGLQPNLGGLAREAEIDIANVNCRKQKDQHARGWQVVVDLVRRPR